MASAAIAVAAIVGASMLLSSPTSGHETAPSPSSETAASGARCDDVATREECRDIVVNGRNLRYTLTKAPTPTTRTVIADFGGPGLSVLGDGYLLTFLAQHPDVASKYNFVAVEEPWFTRDPSPDCRTRLTAFYRSSRTAAPDTQANAQALRTSCGLTAAGNYQWGFDRQTYRDLLTAIQAQNGLHYTGFIGQSFGSVRLGYLAGTDLITKLDWIALSHPFPVGVTGEELVRSRAKATAALVDQLTAGPATLPAAETPSRALPVTRFDELSAAIELGYLPSVEQDSAAAGIAGSQRPALVARLSDQLWQRYGDDAISPAYLAQLDELCTAVPVSSSAGVTESLDGVLNAALLPCRGIAARPADRLHLGSVSTCIAVSTADTVAPVDLAERTLRGISDQLRWIKIDDRSHRSGDGLAQCLVGR
ncbi:hypothetical protein ABT369_39860 [Dactylosporangium sp. NPDC000244]|uniref:hypothetical protein n=1 Tax=Dactylosporangium sp. NPDC000244 TaxID=3154365 RepID=UPI0033249C6C